MNPEQKTKQRINFWLFSSRNLDYISKRFCYIFSSQIIDIDYENVYEWSQQTIGSIYVNISRNNTKPRIKAPISIFFDDIRFYEEQIKSFGMKLHEEYQTTVYRGRFSIQSNDELILEPVETYS